MHASAGTGISKLNGSLNDLNRNLILYECPSVKSFQLPLIDIRIVETENEVSVGVRDYGSGFNYTDRKMLFERFWRADSSRARSTGGTGLGLSIALEDAKLHQGEIDVWGERGKGAHFVLTIPKFAGGSIETKPISAQL